MSNGVVGRLFYFILVEWLSATRLLAQITKDGQVADDFDPSSKNLIFGDQFRFRAEENVCDPCSFHKNVFRYRRLSCVSRHVR